MMVSHFWDVIPSGRCQWISVACEMMMHLAADVLRVFNCSRQKIFSFSNVGPRSVINYSQNFAVFCGFCAFFFCLGSNENLWVCLHRCRSFSSRAQRLVAVDVQSDACFCPAAFIWNRDRSNKQCFNFQLAVECFHITDCIACARVDPASICLDTVQIVHVFTIRYALSFQLNTRREACEMKSTAARNEYLLSLAAANAHVQQYYVNDTPELMKVSTFFLDFFDVKMLRDSQNAWR